MAKAVKLADIAEQVGVSTVTVSKALSGQKGVSEEMREKIKNLAEELGYRSPSETKRQSAEKQYNETVRVSDINHIETENKTVYLRLNNGTSEVVNVSMDELEHQLNPDYFFRANRQYIINVEHVLFLGNYFGGKLIVRLKGYPKTEIQVSKEKAQRLKEWIDR